MVPDLTQAKAAPATPVIGPLSSLVALFCQNLQGRVTNDSRWTVAA